MSLIRPTDEVCVSYHRTVQTARLVFGDVSLNEKLKQYKKTIIGPEVWGQSKNSFELCLEVWGRREVWGRSKNPLEVGT